jgi:hypothetical protein
MKVLFTVSSLQEEREDKQMILRKIDKPTSKIIILEEFQLYIHVQMYT